MDKINAFFTNGNAVMYKGTLATGETELLIYDVGISPAGMYDMYTSKYGVYPKNVEISNGLMKLTFDAQEEDLIVKVVMK